MANHERRERHERIERLRSIAACRLLCLFAAFALPFIAASLHAETPVPEYGECLLTSVFPAGGQRGSTVTVQFTGTSSKRKGGALGGMKNARDIVIDGLPGITVRDVENVADHIVRATFDIASDAMPGRRMVRVKNDRTGLTSGSYYFVGTLPECLDGDHNNSPTEAQRVTLPTVVNGTIRESLDVDCYRFEARTGQKLVAAIACHDLDVRSGTGDTRGYADPSLELLDDEGRVVADAEDIVGLDPLVEYTIPADGGYTARVYLGGYKGFPESSYRLTLGEVAYPTAVFPPGGRRGEAVEVEFRGPNVPAGTRAFVQVPTDERSPLHHIVLGGDLTGTHDVAFCPGDLPEIVEREPNSERGAANLVPLGTTVNAEFDSSGDEDWYRLNVSAGQRVRLEIVSHRYLRLPVDTSIEVFDAAGATVAQNDDAAANATDFVHDYDTFDSSLQFTAKTAGDYLVRVREQTGLSGLRAMYRLTIGGTEPDFRLYQCPDAVPVWGPGSTAAFLVTLERDAEVLKSDVEIGIVGLPEGWKGSTTVVSAGEKLPRAFLTITAPPDAAVGDMATFRVVGRAQVGEQIIEREAIPLNLYLPNTRSLVRISRVARAVVAQAQGPWLDTDLTEATVAVGGQIEVPIRICGGDELSIVDLAGNRPSSAGCGLGVPLKLKPEGGLVMMPLKFEKFEPGTYGITVSLAWYGDVRKGMPGPCTPIILVNVVKP